MQATIQDSTLALITTAYADHATAMAKNATLATAQDALNAAQKDAIDELQTALASFKVAMDAFHADLDLSPPATIPPATP
jgi:putative NADH-flavin reductase